MRAIKTKKCSSCLEVKPLSEFHKDSQNKDGYRPHCKKCRKEGKKSKSTEWYRNRKIYLDRKECKKCGEVKEFSEFDKDRSCKDGHMNKCKMCRKEETKKYREENRERINKRRRTKHGREINRSNNANRRAMKHALPYSTSSELWLGIIMEYGGKCAVTGRDRFDLEHMIPLSIGWGGSLKDNIYPMDNNLNTQKSAKNPFKFMEQLQGQQRTNFEKVLHNLAKENGLTYKEYKKFVNWCFAHPRTLEEVLEDNKLGLTQVELWRIRSGYTPN